MATRKKIHTLPDPALRTDVIEPPISAQSVAEEQKRFTLKDGRTFVLADPGEWVVAQMEEALIAASEIAPALQILMGADRKEITSDMFLEALAGAAPAMRAGLIRRLVALAFIEEGCEINDQYDFNAYARAMSAAPSWTLAPAVTGFFGSIGLFTAGG